MIEQPQTTVLERTTRVVSDANDADIPQEKEEKERLIDEEVVVIKHAPITSQIRKTIRHLHSVGGFTARWRGLGVALCYSMAHSLTSNFLSSFFARSIPMQALGYIVASVLLARIHMTWTHVMISNPSSKPWFKRVRSEREIFKALILPSSVYATAQMLTIGLPAMSMCIFSAGTEDVQRQALGMLMAGAIMLALSVLILLPASVTLTRIEASFLPEDEDTIVPFDRTLNGAKPAAIALEGDDEVVSAPSGKSLFVEAWRSFDMASRLRLIKFYVKMAAIQVMIVLVGMHVVMAEVYLLGMERVTILAQAGHAQLRLAAMGVEQD